MNDDAIDAASPTWVRLFRTAFCFAAAAVVAWRGIVYDDPRFSAAVPFAMCQFMAVILALIGLFNLAGDGEPGPS